MGNQDSSSNPAGTADMLDDNIKKGEQDISPDTPAHTPGTAKGEEKVMNEGKEPGRQDTGGEDRPAGTSTARNSTSVNAEGMEPIDPKMPNMPPA